MNLKEWVCNTESEFKSKKLKYKKKLQWTKHITATRTYVFCFYSKKA